MIAIISTLLIAAGFFFFFATAIGIVRLPDFYCRMHAAGKGDTLSTVLILMGLALLHLEHLSGAALLVSLKIMFIAVFIFMASPTATHAIIDAGFHSGAVPWTKEKDEVPSSKEEEGANP
jgi:multicomponent Na+:H+ antiporter subunit G